MTFGIGRFHKCFKCNEEIELVGASAEYGLGSKDTKGNSIMQNERIGVYAHEKCLTDADLNGVLKNC